MLEGVGQRAVRELMSTTPLELVEARWLEGSLRCYWRGWANKPGSRRRGRPGAAITGGLTVAGVLNQLVFNKSG